MGARLDRWKLVGSYCTADELARFQGLPRVSVATAFGSETVAAFTRRLTCEREFKEEFFAEMRHASWQLRCRHGGGEFRRAELAQFYEGVHMLHAAGGRVDELQAFVACSLASCTCDGCGWASGAAFDFLGR